MIALVIILVFAAILNIPMLVRQRLWKDLWVYSFLYVFILTVVTLQNFGITVPSLLKGVVFIMKNILHIGYE